VVHPSPIGPWPSPDNLTLFRIGTAKVLPFPTGPRVSNQFIACGLLVALMMETESTSETSVNFYLTTRRNNPEDSHLHNRRRENLKSHMLHLFTKLSV
jgi:hypothetical protein